MTSNNNFAHISECNELERKRNPAFENQMPTTCSWHVFDMQSMGKLMTKQ